VKKLNVKNQMFSQQVSVSGIVRNTIISGHGIGRILDDEWRETITGI
jgi:hypothetical protein